MMVPRGGLSRTGSLLNEINTLRGGLPASVYHHRVPLVELEKPIA
jgi:hypothetical protein